MNAVKLILLAGAGFFLYSCGSGTGDKSVHDHEAISSGQHNHFHPAEVIELNNGERWPVNEEMKPYVSGAQTLVDTYIASNGTDFESLAEQLTANNAGLVKSCTMKGKSHTELHKWLQLHLELTEKLSNETEPADAQETVLALQKSFQLYNQYFQ